MSQFDKPIARVTADILRAKILARITGTPLPDLTRLEARRKRLVAQSESLRKEELEIAVRFEEKFESKPVWIQTHPTGEEGFRCPGCGILSREGVHCWGCKEQLDLI